MKESLNKVGAVGGGVGRGSVHNVLRELQGLRVSLVAGGSANAKLALAAIRDTDTIISAINNNAGTLTDITGTMSIDRLAASGTITVGTAVAGDTVAVNGLTYQLVANDATIQATDLSKVRVGASATACAANLAAAINLAEMARLGGVTVSAEAAAAVVTVTAQEEGTAGNAFALVEVGTSFTVSAATLAGGTATGGIRSTGATNQVMLTWFDKQ